MGKSLKLVEAFGDAAMSHGWERDQGNGSDVDRAKREYDETKRQLMRRINFLEKRNAKYLATVDRRPTYPSARDVDRSDSVVRHSTKSAHCD